MFLGTATELVGTLRDQRDSLRDREREAQATIGFAALHSLAQCFFPGWLRQFEDSSPAFSTRLVLVVDGEAIEIVPPAE